MTEKFTCPRRIADGLATADGPFVGSGPNLDEWSTRAGLIGQPSGCTYCGSLPSAMFMDQVRAGAKVGPTDKPYKLYIDVPSRGTSTLRVISSSNSPSGGLTHYRDLSRAEKKAVKEYASSGYPKGFKDHYYGLTTWDATTEAKFYTHHLTEEQGWEFHTLWREHKINWGYPGAPYTRLYIPGPSSAAPDDPRLRE